MIPGVQDPDSSPQAFRRASGQSQSLDEWQNMYSYDIVRTTAGFRGVIMGLKAFMIRFQNPMVVSTA
jgi:hypothetical protein